MGKVKYSLLVFVVWLAYTLILPLMFVLAITEEIVEWFKVPVKLVNKSIERKESINGTKNEKD